MAKKSGASLQTGSKSLTKAIKMVKSPKTGTYMFAESVMAPEFVNDWFKSLESNFFMAIFEVATANCQFIVNSTRYFYKSTK